MFRSIRRLHTYSSKPLEILKSALSNVPEKGFENALISAVREQNYSDATLAVLRPFDVVMYHLQTSRQELQGKVSDNRDNRKSTDTLASLVKYRLQANRALGDKLSDALAIMTLPTNMPASLGELHELSDEIAFLSGDKSTGADWYTKRAAISSLYVASELFMTTDTSTNFEDTMRFVDARVKELDKLGYYSNSTTEWLKFNAISAFNVVRSFS